MELNKNTTSRSDTENKNLVLEKRDFVLLLKKKITKPVFSQNIFEETA